MLWRRIMSFCSEGDVFTKDVIETWLEYKRKA